MVFSESHYWTIDYVFPEQATGVGQLKVKGEHRAHDNLDFKISQRELCFLL